MRLRRTESILRSAINEGAFPGCAFAVSDPGRTVVATLGKTSWDDQSSDVSETTLYDLASLTKVLVTTTLTMIAVSRGVMSLDDPLACWIPEYEDRPAVTLRHLLLHRSGLPAFRPYADHFVYPHDVARAIRTEALDASPGEHMVYSDLGMILLGWALESAKNASLDGLFADRVAIPLGLSDSFFVTNVAARSSRANVLRFAPTESVPAWRRRVRAVRGYHDLSPMIRGEVHDPTAFLLGGVAGHAGLFSTIGDVLTLMEALVHDDRLIPRPAREEFTQPSDGPGSRALGWDTRAPVGSSAGNHFSPRSFGHTGYTGTSIWVDPERELIAILLTNRVHPTAENVKIMSVRPAFHDAVIEDIERK